MSNSLKCNHYLSLQSIVNQPIHKDQCGRCFETTKSKEGLDICMLCLQVLCKGEVFNHSKKHRWLVGNKDHVVYMNIREVAKENKTENKKENKMENEEITKIAIGKEGGIEIENEVFETKVELTCIECNVNIPKEITTTIENNVDYIINASSASEAENIKAWELEIFPCEHTLTLQQNRKTEITKINSKCNDCHLNSNLWLCLTCGNLGCGRKQYDGSGGNGHGIDHFKKTNHPLAVKTGTITPRGEASVYCYSCDNDVKDEDLNKHLINFGMRLEDQVKTEKNVTELNLDLNVNFTLSKTIEEGVLLRNVFGPGKTGIENIGNSCYMNSVIQVLFSMRHFQERYYDSSMDHLISCIEKNPYGCYECQFAKVAFGLCSGLYSKKEVRRLKGNEEEEYQKGIKPSSFKYFIAKDNEEFMSNRQQDAFEYMNFLLDRIEKEETLLKRKNLKNLFSFDVNVKLICSLCKSYRIFLERNTSIIFPIHDWKEKKDNNQPSNIEDLIKNWLSDEVIEHFCTECNRLCDFYKSQRIINYPSYFIIVYQRFVFDWIPYKLDIDLGITEKPYDFSCFSKDFSSFPSQKQLFNPEKLEKLKDEKKKKFVFDSKVLEDLVSMGIPMIGAKNACIRSNNKKEEAINWYFNNMDTQAALEEIDEENDFEGVDVNEECVNVIVEMGFTVNQAKGSLIKNKNNVEEAINFLFNNFDCDFSGIVKKNEEFFKEKSRLQTEITVSTNTNQVNNLNLEHVNKSYSLYGKCLYLLIYMY